MTLAPSLESPTTSRDESEGVSPTFNTDEDVQRFTAESLHSFSFADKSDDVIKSRHSVLRRTIDFLRNGVGPASGNLGMASARAKVSGDPEMQDMVDLLSKANIFGLDGEGQGPAPLTGPAHTTDENLFEKSFATQTESPTSMEHPTSSAPGIGPHEATQLATDSQTSGSSRYGIKVVPSTASSSDAKESSSAISPTSTLGNQKGILKRTFTDVAPLFLQSKLTDALAQPYMPSDNREASSSTSNNLLNTPFSPTTANFTNSATSGAHGRGAPSTQAIIMTETNAPWTTTAANDFACLMLGLSKTEIRKIGMLEVFREDKRRWLESRLKGRESSLRSPRSPISPRKPLSPLGSSSGEGLTAKLLRKPPSRETSRARRTRSYQEYGTRSLDASRQPSLENGSPGGSRGVLLCGDVLPMLKRDGAVGSATLWVQEKRGCLIWVLEEIAEDVAILKLDEIGCIMEASGQVEAVWGMERVRRGMDITRLIPGIPRTRGTNTGALDFDRIAEQPRFTARTANDISTPITVERIPEESSFRVSSFPHIAGMLVLSSSSLKISSANSVVSETLFGRALNGVSATDVIPKFDKMLNLLVEEDRVQLVEGIVIPEHSFRRARAMLALREGKEDAAAVFLRPSGLPATHRDGAEIMVDVQMRVLRSETINSRKKNGTIAEADEASTVAGALDRPSSEVVYALWVTYSRVMHAANHGIGPISPLVSRPGTPPRQPSPGDSVTSATSTDSDNSSGEETRVEQAPTPPLSPVKSRQSTKPAIASGVDDSPKTDETINDFVILEDMGAGAYGQVKLCRPKTGGPSAKKVVIKYVTKRRILVDTWTRDRRLGTVPLEIHVLEYLRRDGYKHPNIVEMTGFFEDDVNYYIKMVPHGLPGMDLFDYIELRAFNMSEEECRRIFAQVASAIEFLHVKAKVVHRDIKDENVVLDGEGNVKLIDFGSASYVRNGPFDVFVGTIGKPQPRFFLDVAILEARRY